MFIDLNLEAYLPEDIYSPGNYYRVSCPKHIFLTGGTGYLGAFLIRDLLKLTKANIYCLVRASDEVAAKARLIENLNRYSLRCEQYMSRIVVVCGDIEKPQFGLSQAVYHWLSTNVETITSNYSNNSFV